MTAPALPPDGQAGWRNTWGQWVHDQATKVFNKIGASDLSAVGTRSASTFLRGDNVWASPPSSGVAAESGPTPALSILRAGLAARKVFPCRIVFAGSSTVSGAGASVEARRFVNVLVASLQATYPSGGSEPAVVNSATAEFGALSSAAGVHGYNAGISGSGSSTYLTTDTKSRIAAINPRMVVHVATSNDYAGGVDPATTKSRLLAHIQELDAAISGPCVHVLIHPQQRGDVASPVYAWSEYERIARELSEEYPDLIAFIDVSDPFRLADAHGTDPLDLLADTVHPSDAGHALIADEVHDELAARRATVAVTAPTQAILAADTFTRADSTTGLGTAETGQVWTSSGTVWTISSGRATTGAYAFLPCGSGDMDVACDVIVSTVTGAYGISINASSANDRLSFYFDAASATWRFSKSDAGTLTVLQQGSYTTVAGQTYRLRAISKGNLVTYFINGVEAANYTLTTAEQTKYKAYQSAGLRLSNSTAAFFDNFEIKAPA